MSIREFAKSILLKSTSFSGVSKPCSTKSDEYIEPESSTKNAILVVASSFAVRSTPTTYVVNLEMLAEIVFLSLSTVESTFSYLSVCESKLSTVRSSSSYPIVFILSVSSSKVTRALLKSYSP